MSNGTDGVPENTAPVVIQHSVALSLISTVFVAVWSVAVVHTDRLTSMLPDVVAYRIFYPSMELLSSGFFATTVKWTIWSSFWMVPAACLIPACFGMYTYSILRRTRSIRSDLAVWVPLLVAWHVLWIGYLLDDVVWWGEIRSATSVCSDVPYDYKRLLWGVLAHIVGLVLLFGAALLCRNKGSLILRWIFVLITALWLVTVAFPAIE